jgi:hypothetical protein
MQSERRCKAKCFRPKPGACACSCTPPPPRHKHTQTKHTRLLPLLQSQPQLPAVAAPLQDVRECLTSLYAVVPLVVPHTPDSAQVAPCSATARLITLGGGTGAPEMPAAGEVVAQRLPSERVNPPKPAHLLPMSAQQLHKLATLRITPFPSTPLLPSPPTHLLLLPDQLQPLAAVAPPQHGHECKLGAGGVHQLLPLLLCPPQPPAVAAPPEHGHECKPGAGGSSVRSAAEHSHQSHPAAVAAVMCRHHQHL